MHDFVGLQLKLDALTKSNACTKWFVMADAIIRGAASMWRTG